MKRFRIHVGAASVLLTALAFAPVAQAEYKCANPNGSIEQRACAMAATGPEALRRFVERTRGIYLIYYWDYVRTD